MSIFYDPSLVIIIGLLETSIAQKRQQLFISWQTILINNFCFYWTLYNKIEMDTQEGSSLTKSSKPTMRFTNSPFLIREESSILSLNIEDLRELMKKKEKEYQGELLIEDAKRVRGFLIEVQEQQKQKEARAREMSKRRQRKTMEEYNNETLEEFQEDWRKNLEEVVKDIEDACAVADQEHEAELVKAEERIEEASNGKGLENLKFSRTVLEMEDQLLKLVKLQEYDQAQVVSKRLQKCKKTEISQFLRKSVQKQRRSLQVLKLQQRKEKDLLNRKFNKMITQEQTKRGREIEKLVKNIRTFEIDPKKVETRINRRLKDKPKGRESQLSHNSAFKKVEICQALQEGKNAKQEV